MRSVLASVAVTLLLCGPCAQAVDSPTVPQNAAADRGMLLGTWDRVREAGDRDQVSAATANLLHIKNDFGNTHASPVIIIAAMPPLKHQYLAKWVDFIRRSHEADERGQPLATGYSHCLPDGMPTMMQGMFPMQ